MALYWVGKLWQNQSWGLRRRSRHCLSLPRGKQQQLIHLVYEVLGLKSKLRCTVNKDASSWPASWPQPYNFASLEDCERLKDHFQSLRYRATQASILCRSPRKVSVKLFPTQSNRHSSRTGPDPSLAFSVCNQTLILP